MKIVGTIDLAQFPDHDYDVGKKWLRNQLKSLRKNSFESHERIIVVQQWDYYVKDHEETGLILKNLQIMLNEEDITNCFVQLRTTNPDIAKEVHELQQMNVDSTQIEFQIITGPYRRQLLDRHPYSQEEEYQYGSANPIKVKLTSLSLKKQFLLSQSKTFCMYPWVHLHAWPNGQAYPCCHAESTPIYGSTRTQSLKEIWNEQPMKKLRQDMLNETANESCTRCYEQEKSGFFSGRQSSNKHHGHQIDKIDQTQDNGYLDQFEMTYWDIRFSNLCNLKCRSCGHIFSSQWYQDQAKLAGGEWKDRNQVLNYAGRTETDMWEQLIPHLDHVEQIYFAGGEPLLMAEHYNILDELVRRKRFDVRLIYNTNFTHTDLKGRSVFEYWKQFKSVAVGASLDDSGSRGEYIRKGTDWAVVEQNRRDMLRVCPEVDFYISPTLSIMNAWHLPDFHRDWVEKGLIRAQDLNVNILQDPAHYRIDIAPAEYKHSLTALYQSHIHWLKGQDPLNRATQGFESAITFMNATDNTHLIDTFWRKTNELDSIRNEHILDTIPELAALK
jgi:radical SAM protein with 4Fe4S-binding SPASM domain